MPELAIYFCPFYGPQPLHLFNPHVLSSHFPEALDTSGFPINFSPTHHGTPAFINLSEPVRREREAASTILGLILKQPMEGVNGRRRTLKERLGLKGFGCCGATWGVRQSTVDVRDDEDPSPSPSPSPSPPPPLEEVIMGQASAEGNSDPMDCLLPASSGMNLAAALAAERQFREVNELANTREGPIIGSMTAPGTPWRMSLMRLLNETEENKEEKVGAGNDTVCCVCMGRQKGAAFIPCGHTFCRVCSRELWLNRGSCPLCNQSILEILDIF